MSTLDTKSEERSFIQRFGFAIGILAIFLIGAGTVAATVVFGNREAAPRRISSITSITLPALPPPPPPVTPPPPPPPQEEKMVEQAPIAEDEPKPDDAPKTPEPQSLATNIAGNGSDAFGLSSRGTGSWLGDGSKSRGSGTKFGWYAGQVQRSISDALRKNPATRSATIRVEARIWPDAAGRISRAKLSGTTGNPEIDGAIQNQILAGLQLQEPPPPGMPLPIVMRITARRPN